MTNRIAIFIFYDPQGIVDDYVPYFLERLKPFLKNLIIVVNGELTAEGRKKLKPFTKNIFVRENIGYEPGAIKDVLFKFYGMSKILEHDELLICNDTFYGPFFDIKELFDKMDKTKCDFWGITEQAARKNHHPKHIQSYFYNIKKSLLHNKHFINFFEKLPLPDNKQKAINNYEIAMSQFFLKADFSYAAFANIEDFIEDDANKNFNYSVFAPINLLKGKCPFIKRGAFFDSSSLTIFFQGGEQSGYLMQFIENYTEYSPKMIWQNLLRRANVTDIKDKLHLQYIFPKNTLLSNSKNIENQRVIVVAYLFYAKSLDESLAYLNNIPKFIDLIITTPKPEIAKAVREYFGERRKCEIKLTKNKEWCFSKDILANYDYLCYINDKNISENFTKMEISSFRFLLWECALASEHYIKNVLNKFENEPKLGFLNVPQPFHGEYFKTFISELTPIFTVETAFWARCDALKQNHNYYSGICLTDSYAQIRINYLEFMIRVKEKKKEEERMLERKILPFTRTYPKIYIYGAGFWGKKVAEILNFFKMDYNGFIVSRKEKDMFLKHKVYELNEIKMDKDTGIILGLGKKNTLEVLRILKKKNVNMNNLLKNIEP